MRVYDFFAGCGGTSSGLSQAGFKIAAGLDSDADAAKTFIQNLEPDVFIAEDIRAVREDNLSLSHRRDTPVLFCGCAPCQPFSRQNRKCDAQDPRRSLLNEFSRFVSFWLPEYVLVENVPGLQKIPNTEGPFKSFLKTLSDLGYYYTYDVLPALMFGVPQTRDRLILLASRQAGLMLPVSRHGASLAPAATVRDWIGDLPPIAAGETHDDDPDHQAAYLSDLNLTRITATPEGGGRDSWPDELWLDCHKGHKGHSDVYGRLAWDRPASGLTTRCISYSNGRFGHPEQNRALSIREAANLQTFPRRYSFVGSLRSRGRQVGNAVPPLMAQRIGEAIRAHAEMGPA
ncbi:DNA cytosine methyltransferase [Methylobacterium sp. CM6244]